MIRVVGYPQDVDRQTIDCGLFVAGHDSELVRPGIDISSDSGHDLAIGPTHNVQPVAAQPYGGAAIVGAKAQATDGEVALVLDIGFVHGIDLGRGILQLTGRQLADVGVGIPDEGPVLRWGQVRGHDDAGIDLKAGADGAVAWVVVGVKVARLAWIVSIDIVDAGQHTTGCRCIVGRVGG